MDLSLIYFPSAVALGGLHALEPGHAKTLTAAYLIGTKGTKRDATLLGLSVALTHSIVVIGLSVIAVLIGKEAFTDQATYYISVGSSVVVIALGVWLLSKRIKALRRVRAHSHHHHHDHTHAPEPAVLEEGDLKGEISIVSTPAGERFQLTLDRAHALSRVEVHIAREAGTPERHVLLQTEGDPSTFLSIDTPAEPHEFSAHLKVSALGVTRSLPFSLREPDHNHHHHDHDHDHDHSLMSDDEHARAHAADLPDYVHKGERPSAWQIIAFGAAGGITPCPAAISVMLLSLSVSKTGMGLFMVLGFSLGLALTLVGVGLLVVTGLSRLDASGKLSRLSVLAPSIASGMVIVSGGVGLLTAVSGAH